MQTLSELIRQSKRCQCTNLFGVIRQDEASAMAEQFLADQTQYSGCG